MSQSALKPLQEARFILASSSPRRKQLLAQLGLSVEVMPSEVDEVIAPHLTPPELVESLSHAKAADVASRHAGVDLILGADTIVVLGEKILGKPKDAAEARRMIGSLQNNWHQVFTGYTLIAPGTGRFVTGHTVTHVHIRKLSDEEIDHYVETGEPMDKAGSYAIQELGTLFVDEIRGSYTNVVGLPLPSVDAAWRELGWRVL